MITTTYLKVIDGVIVEELGTITVTFTTGSGGASSAPIQSISVNGTNVPPIGSNVDITVPTKTSELEKDDVYTKSEVDNKLSAVYKFKGSVPTFDDLPTDAENADVYNVIDSGSNFAWVSLTESWDALGGVTGLATLTENGLLSKEDFAKIQALATTYAPIVHDHNGQVINPDAVILNKAYTDLTMVDLVVGSIFYNSDQLCWLLKTSSETYQNIGEELPMICKNGDTFTHLEGQAVYVKSGVGGLPVLKLTSSSIGKLNAIATQNVLNSGNGRGYYCFFGQARKFPYSNVIKSTDSESTWIEGAELFLCNEAGKYSTTKEVAPAKSSKVGVITMRAGANISVLFTPQETHVLEDASNVDGATTTFEDTEELLIKKTDGLWKRITKSNFATAIGSLFAKLSGDNIFTGNQTIEGPNATLRIKDNDGAAIEFSTIIMMKSYLFGSSNLFLSFFSHSVSNILRLYLNGA